MAITPYCSINEWAQKKGYDTFALFIAKHTDYVTEEALTDMLEEATSMMNDEIGSGDTNITDTRYTTILRNLCYRMSNLMVDEEQGRAHEQKRSQYIPRDYMYERDRSRLQRIGLVKGYRAVGQVG